MVTMLEAYASDFEAKIEFERFAISKAIPLLSEEANSTSARISLDDRPAAIALTLTSTTGQSIGSFLDELGLRPLLFGAAWKILYLLVEFALPVVGGKRQTIEHRVNAMKLGSVSVTPLSTNSELWSRIRSAYVESVEYRHSIVHRTVGIGADKELIAHSRIANSQSRGLTVEEQIAFCRLAQRVASSVISGELSNRESRALLAELNRLTLLTGEPATDPLSEAPRVIRVTIPVKSSVKVSMADVERKVLKIFPNAKDVDVIFELEDQQGKTFRCFLEEVRDLEVDFSSATIPEGLQPL